MAKVILSHSRSVAVYLAAALLLLLASGVLAWWLLPPSNYAAAPTGISWWTFLWATGIGILPLTVLPNVLGDRMLTMPLWAWLALGGIAALTWVALHLRWRGGIQTRRSDDRPRDRC
ncbi:MAG: hypothetical protein HY526_08845 [Betaproteobacteria bacterium]|nr:hypothetical protein [Betaproteobacteria bacterium]